MPIFLALGNHGLNSSDTNHPALLTWPEDRAVSTSNGHYSKDTYCCLDATSSASHATAWYAFDAGSARFYVLNTAWSDSNVGTATEYKNDYDYHLAPGTWISMDVTAYITGNGTYNLALTTPGSIAVSLASRQSGANTPQLIIETSP